MNYRVYFSLLLLSGLSLFTVSGQEKLLTIEDVSYMNRSLFPARVAQLQWIGSTDDYAYANGQSIYRVSARKGTETLLIDLDMLNSALRVNGHDSIQRVPGLDFHSDDACLFRSGEHYFQFNYRANQLERINTLPDTAENIDLHRETGMAAYTQGNNLFIAAGDETIQVTADTEPGIVNGQTVHRVEFGINKGIFWSPDGSKLAFYRKDETMVTDYPLVDVNARIAEVENTKYPMAGMTSEEVVLGVYDLSSGVTIYMKTGSPKDQYLTSVTWGPDNESIYIGLLNRGQDHLRLNQYDVSTGELIKTLFEEKNPKYVEPETPLYFNPEDPEQFIWLSERDGYNHLYLYDTGGKLIRQLTKGEWVVTQFIGYYSDGLAYFTSTREEPIQQNIYSVRLKDGEITRISPDHGTHSAKVSKSGKYIIDTYSSTEASRTYKLINQKGKEVRVIKEDKLPLKDYRLGDMEIFTLEADDGTPLYCRLIKPVDFDPDQKYPVLIYVYGGPHAQLVTDSWLGGAGLFLNYMAQRGFVVFTLDNRGSANRGRDFEQAVFRNLGETEMNDQMAGVVYLKSLPYVDPERIGVTGWSYGGFMTTTLMLRQPGVFRVGVAGGPVIDWQYYEVMYGERYMDTPEENPDGYDNANLLNYVGNLEGKLLLIHGTSDPTVVWQHSLLFLKEAVKQGKLMDYFVYPGHGHGVGGTDRVHLNKMMSSYIMDNL